MVKIGGTNKPSMDEQNDSPTGTTDESTSTSPAWKIRLEILKDNLLSLMKGILNEPTVISNFKSVIDLFINETHIYMKDMTAEEVKKYTHVQIEALQTYNSKLPYATAPTQRLTSKLPKLLLPTYKGDITKWSEFWDRFQTSVDRQNLANTDKLTYLLASLEDEALQTIEGLDITSENYEVALNILKERFGKPGAVIDAHYEALYSMKRARTNEDCMNTYNEIEKHLRILKALGEDTNHNNLRSVIVSKFPDDFIYEIKCKVKIEEQSVENLRKLLEHSCSARVSTNKNMLFSTASFSSTQITRRAFKRKLLMQHPENSKKRRLLGCIFCGGAHFNDACKQVSSVEERKTKIKGRCFVCFKSDHLSDKCASEKKCFHCKGKHNRALCANRKKTSLFKINNNKGMSILQTAIAYVKDTSGKSHKCRLLLDTGSQRSYISNSFAKLLNLKIINRDQLMVYTFGQNKPRNLESPRVKVELICGPRCIREIELNIVPFIAHEIPYFDFREASRVKVRPADDGSMGSEVNILIGNDYYISFIKENRKQISEDFSIIETDFGWVCSGRLNIDEEHLLSIGTYLQTYVPDNLGFIQPDLPIKETDVSQMWELESIGIRDCPKTTNEEEAVQHFNETVTYENNRYQVKWPWTQYPPHLPTNYGLASGRLTSLIKRLKEEMLVKYDNIIQEQENLGIIEKVDDFLAQVSHPVHYLPHHCVLKKDGSTSLRIVYDASSKAREDLSSLNECMYKGPLLLEDLVGLLLKFRQYKVGITADIEKAFLQLGLQEEDRDVTRFLWVKDITKGVCKENLVCYRFNRVPFGIISSPFLLNATIKFHLLRSNDNVLQKTANNIYVDNLILGSNDTEEATVIFEKLFDKLKRVSMRLRQWNSNEEQFLQRIPQELREDASITKVLGLIWDTMNDTLAIKSHDVAKQNSITKRKVLKEIASVYDPCGFITPLLLPAKLFLQNLWKLKVKWDTKLSADLEKEWLGICKNLEEIKNVKLDRFVGINGDDVERELHCFADASKDAYAAAVYLKSYSKSETKIKLLMSKSKLTPIKDQQNLQIPKLELLATLVGIRLLAYIQRNIDVPITKEYLWTDSQVVIRWLNSEKLLLPFISRRVTEIKKRATTNILYVSTTQNPADIATRITSFNKEKKEMWFDGPHFLKENSDYQNNWAITHASCASEGLSDYNESKQRNENNTGSKRVETVEEKIKREQELHYPREYRNQITDLGRCLGTFKDENGILRCKSRVVIAEVPYDTKYPILLPKDSPLTEEIIMKTHKENYHVGVGHTLSLVRVKYWILQGRSAVQKTLKKCFECKKHGGGPYRLPCMPELPKERVKYSSPFTFTGLDYLGPILIINEQGQQTKRWICIYTCLAVRSIHLEVVKDLSAEECTLALRRFASQRGLPQLFLSDNAAQFKLTAELLTGPYCIENNLKWKFTPELAPWHGGLYERLVSLVKRCFKRTLDIRQLNDTQLQTITKEIETVLNTRPLTYVGSEPEHILKPNDFLRTEFCLIQPSDEPYLCQRDTTTKQMLIDGWKKGQRMVEEFRKMFINQYLMTLKERKDIEHKQPRITSKQIPKVGDVVQIKGDSNNRALWKVGTVATLHKGRDGEVRVATIRVGEKEYTRSIGHLYPLEIEESIGINHESTDIPIPSETTEKPSESQLPEVEKSNDILLDTERVGRAAAQRARERISSWTKELVQLIFIQNTLQK